MIDRHIDKASLDEILIKKNSKLWYAALRLHISKKPLTDSENITFLKKVKKHEKTIAILLAGGAKVTKNMGTGLSRFLDIVSEDTLALFCQRLEKVPFTCLDEAICNHCSSDFIYSLLQKTATLEEGNILKRALQYDCDDRSIKYLLEELLKKIPII